MVVQTIRGGIKMKRLSLMMISFVGLLLILTGCFEGEQSIQEIDAPKDDIEEKAAKAKDTIKEDQKKETEKKDDKAKKTNSKKDEASDEKTAREIYLIDANGLIASQTLELPKVESKEVATQALEHMVKGGPVTEMLPNGFQAVLPEDTEILGLNLKEDGTMIVDVSKEFKNYPKKNEVKILEAMTHTLTQFEDVKKIQLWINGHPQDKMPVDGTPINEGYSKANGINVMNSTTDLFEAEAVTMFYPKEYHKNRYYVPVTKHVNVDQNQTYTALIESLLDGPALDTNALNVFNEGTTLKGKPELKDGILQVEFSKEIMKDNDKNQIADEVIETLVRTLTELEDVEAVDISVEDVKSLVNEQGESYDEPVSKHKYKSHEKL